ncbi:hypothetical protein MNBD_GAMMA12-2727 [hydrothermal vent metagenome]|uniref:Uncharacterized protein n=1 Tax=hydrothermal vent metagenome TaxID=652676 RepID=A0A3B0Y2U7_9ZZZZ
MQFRSYIFIFIFVLLLSEAALAGPLQHAASQGDLVAVKLQLKKSPDLNGRDRLGMTALDWSSRLGHIQMATLLLKQGADVDAISGGGTALVHAASRGHIAMVKLLLKHGAKVNVNPSRKGSSAALIVAVRSNKMEVVNLLLSHKANVNTKGHKGVTALILASAKGYLAIVKNLLRAGANLESMSRGRTALMVASSLGHVAIVAELLRHGANVNVRTPMIESALMIAATKGHVLIVNLLLNKGAKVNVIDKFGDTSLMLSSYNGHVAVVDALLRHGAKLELKNREGKTALIRASRRGHSTIVALLRLAQSGRILLGKIIAIGPKRFTNNYPAVWFCPNKGKVISIKEKKLLQNDQQCRVLIEPGDPEFLVRTKVLNKKKHFLQVGVGFDLYINAKKGIAGTSLLRLGKSELQVPNPVFVYKDNGREWVFVVITSKQKERTISFYWRPLTK